MRYDPARLFRRETNEGYAWVPADATEELRTVAESFGVALGAVERLRKPNPFSALYRAAGVVLRAVDAAEALSAEQQAAILNAIPYERTIKPLRSRGGAYVVLAGGSAWMAYPELPGTLFTGAKVRAEEAVNEAIRFLEVLRDAEAGLQTDALPTVRHRPAGWATLVERLEVLGPAPETGELLTVNRTELDALGSRLAHLELRSALVHNDLNHSNVLVGSGKIYFLDPEDLRFEDRRIAAAHAAFKLLRHAVYSGADEPERLRVEALPAILKRLRSLRIKGREDLWEYGAYRIVSDLYEIAAYTEETGDGSQLYDLDKRVSNIFELYDLLRSDCGPAVTG